MAEKKEYLIEFDDIILRRARKDDNMEDIAKLLYDTDPYIYPYWFNNDIEEAANVIAPRMYEDGFIFNYENCYIAIDKETEKIVGVVCAITPDTNLEYDYSDLMNINNNYKFTIENYIKYLIDEVNEKKYMYLTNISIDVNYRSKKIGTRILKNFIEQMHESGYDEIGFDCLMHNLRAKNLYHSLGFKEVADGIGFDGTDDSTVEVVFFKKKNTPYTSEDFQMLADTNIKETDLAREKYLYEALNRKKANGEE